MRRKVCGALLAASLLGASLAPPAFAQADKFGPGNGGGGGVQKCHPPGQTTDVPGCK
jgi:hypothetical protein